MSKSKSIAFALMALLVLVAAADFTLRGPLRAANARDLASPYVSALRLIRRQNPYLSDTFQSDWHSRGASQNVSMDQSGQHPIYPPTALIVLAPLATLSWPSAIWLYTLGCSIAYVCLVALLSTQVGDSIRSLRRLGFIVFALGISPIHAGIAEANPSIIVLILCGFALFLASASDSPTAGILLALGFCVKPTTAMAAVLVLLLYRRVKSLSTFLGVSALITIGAAIAMSHVPSGWRADYQNNLHMLFGHNGAADFAADNTGRFDLVNLQVPLYSAFHSVRLANVSAVGTAGALAIVWLSIFYKERDTAGNGSYWLAAGTLSLIALLPVYQRNYNAGVILLMAVWIFQNLDNVYARSALIASAAFLFPGEAILRKSGIGHQFANTGTWNTVVIPHLTWSILAVIVICCLYKVRNCVPAALSSPLPDTTV